MYLSIQKMKIKTFKKEFALKICFVRIEIFTKKKTMNNFNFFYNMYYKFY